MVFADEYHHYKNATQSCRSLHEGNQLKIVHLQRNIMLLFQLELKQAICQQCIVQMFATKHVKANICFFITHINT